MNLTEFKEILTSVGLINDKLKEEEVGIHFAQSLNLYVNELESEKHLHASYLEFLEAFARVCDQASLTVIFGEDPEAPQNQVSDEDRLGMPLHDKIEVALSYLLVKCTTKGFQDRFETLKKHPQVGLYILPTKKFF